MQITHRTLVKEALHSSDRAREVFIGYGVDPVKACEGMENMVSMGTAAVSCGIKDLDGLIRDLQSAIDQQVSGRGTEGGNN